MTIPGFAAEASLYRNAGHYRTAASRGPGDGALLSPAQSHMLPLPNLRLAPPFVSRWIPCWAASLICSARNQHACNCPPGHFVSGAPCVDIFTDKDNCGGCGNRCPSGYICSGGACVCEFPPCNGMCLPSGQECCKEADGERPCGKNSCCKLPTWTACKCLSLEANACDQSPYIGCTQ